MGETSRATEPLFRSSAEIRISATPQEIYELISCLPRSGEWSPECQGGTWVVGEPATVGAVFRGENLRSPDVVSWAPVVRGTWTTYAEVVAAEPGRTFRWAMHDSAGRKQSSVWAFDIEAAAGGSVLTHHFRMDTATEGILGITAEMDETRKQQFFKEWGDKVAGDLAATLERVKAVIEKQ
ncbi:SRPBCC family protein [Streptomyces sp. TG1A-8]|uniref:SRPBCC family protein n=1 Tax=Streptomyces sp. TG1A-8 TaxID=3051385 RepID=UPI00265C8A99|nr:SRPBCC family protein [Streptomyces sp. TG1A-8]MDO0925225.1 SRPBCC family protein [Streptomyces sp. TG1A-8]